MADPNHPPRFPIEYPKGGGSVSPTLKTSHPFLSGGTPLGAGWPMGGGGGWQHKIQDDKAHPLAVDGALRIVPLEPPALPTQPRGHVQASYGATDSPPTDNPELLATRLLIMAVIMALVALCLAGVLAGVILASLI